ncbi:MAG: hypothetical protein ABL919_16595 [Methylococcales bacterium]
MNISKYRDTVRLAFGLFFASLGFQALWFDAFTPQLQNFQIAFADAPRGAIMLNGTLLLGCGLAIAANRYLHIAAALLTLVLGVPTILHGYSLLSGDAAAPAIVALLECALFLGLCLHLADLLRGRVLQLLCGTMFVAFGLIHLIEHRDLEALVPNWLPAKTYWLWLTGSIQIVAGIAFLFGRYLVQAATAIGGMYLAWIPLVHAPRLTGNPNSHFEWSFATIALCLAAATLLAAMTAQHEPRAVA